MDPNKYPAPRLTDFSPPKQRVRLCDPTSDAVARHTLERLESLLIKESTVEETLEKIETAADRYRKQHRKLKDKIYLYRAVLAPVRRLPAEVLTIIFGFLVATSPDDIVRVGLVCTQWRHASLCSELWSNIIIPGESHALMTKVKLFAERSSHRPLTVSYEQSGVPTSRWKAWSALMSTGPRWIAVTLTFDDCKTASSRIPQLAYSPFLQTLSVTVRRQSPCATDEGRFGFEHLDPAKTPSLRSLSISTHILPRTSLLFLKLTQLHITDTFYALDRPMNSIEPIEGQHILNVLRSCPNLEDLSIDAEKSSSFFNMRHTILDVQGWVVELPNLRHLYLSCHYTVGYNLLHQITADNVDDVTLRLLPRVRSTENEPSGVAGHFVARCLKIRSLSLYGMNPTALLKSARHGLQLLEELHLEHASQLDIIATALRMPQRLLNSSDDFWFAPRLSTFSILANWFDVPFDEFAMVIKARYYRNRRFGEPACIQNFVVNDQDMMGAAPGDVVEYKRPKRFCFLQNKSEQPVPLCATSTAGNATRIG